MATKRGQVGDLSGGNPKLRVVKKFTPLAEVRKVNPDLR